jgi:hypothetical protein
MGIWFLLYGLFHLVSVPQSALILAVFALVVGILLIARVG